MTRQIKRKSELYKNLMNPDMLVPIKIEKPNENNTRKTKRLATKREGTIVKTANTEQNVTRVNTTSANENLVTTNSATIEVKKESVRNSVKRTSVRAKDK